MNEKVLNEARSIIAGFLRNRRLELGLSQQQLADACGMSVGTINRLENGHFWPVMKQYLIICHALGLMPTITTTESDSDIAEALRSEWVNGPSISEEKVAKGYDNAMSSMAERVWMPEGFKEGAKWMRKKLTGQ